MLRYFNLIFTTFLLLSVSAFSQVNERTISHDSLMSLNEKAFKLIFKSPQQADSLANVVHNLALYKNDSVAIARAVSVKGSISWAYAKYNLSLKWYFDALGKNEDLKDTLGIIACYNNIAEVYKKLQFYENSLLYLHRARRLIDSYLQVESTILNNLNIAQVFISMNTNDSASFYLNLAHKMPEKESSIKMVSFKNYLYAKLRKNQMRLHEAIVYAEQSIHFAKIINNEVRLADAYLLTGELYFLVNSLEKANVETLKALEIATKLGYDQIKLEAYETLYQIALMGGNNHQAFEYLQKYSNLKNSIYNETVARQVAEFETVYQLEKIEKENSLLQQKQDNSKNIIKYQVGFLIAAILALVIAVYFILALNKQRKFLEVVNAELEAKRKQVEYQKKKLEKQSKTTDALNKELNLLNKNLDSRAQVIAREMEVKNKKMNKYAFMNAHKLRAPIASILGLINLFGKDISDEDEKTMISMLKQSADKLDEVVHEIKDVIDE